MTSLPASAEALIAVCERAALEAAEAILAVYAGAFEVLHKSDASPVTEADVASERIIIRVLTEAFPDIPVLSEEQTERDGLPADADTLGLGRFWAVDPLDGTKEFVARNGEFSINIGLVENGQPIMGLIHGPVSGVTYAACGTGTAMRRQRGSPPEPIAARAPGPEGLIVVHSRSNATSSKIDAFLTGQRVSRRMICGSALKFGVLACGDSDVYPRFGPTMEWDTAAGQAILEAAGGSVETIEGKTLRYGKPGFLNGGFIARGRPA